MPDSENDLQSVRHVQVRLTEEEYKLLKEKADAEKLRLQPLVRKLLLESISDPRRVNFANVAGLFEHTQEVTIGNEESPL